jgi:PAS domain S-box-containing protein
MPQPDCLPPPELPGDSHYRQIVASAIDYAIITCTENGCITSWNRGAESVLGWTAQEMRGESLHRIFTPEDVAHGVVEIELQRAKAQARAVNDRWHLRKGGARFWASGETMPLLDDEGRGQGFVKIMRDLTPLMQRTRDLEFVARASESLAGSAGEVDMLARLAQIAVEHYAELCLIALGDAQSPLRRVALVHQDPQWHARLSAIEARRAAGDGPLEALLRAADGQARLVADLDSPDLETLLPSPGSRQDLRDLGLRSCMVAPLVAQGERLGVICLASGVSGRHYRPDDLALLSDLARRAAVAVLNQRLLRALRETDRAKDVFLATLAHELRNPLAPIANGLAILQRVPGDQARVEQVSAMIGRQVQQLTRLVDDLMDVSRIATGKLQIKPEVSSLVSILGAAVEMSRPHIEAAHHQLVLAYTEEPTPVLGDPARLAQVFTNILNNAAKYTPRGGRIEVSVRVQGDELQVRVRDNGAGIEPCMLRQVFGLFTQIPQRGDRHTAGLGIGLSLVDGLVRLHGGRVEARSAGLGQGTEFVVHLPRHPQTARAEATELSLQPDAMAPASVLR